MILKGDLYFAWLALIIFFAGFCSAALAAAGMVVAVVLIRPQTCLKGYPVRCPRTREWVRTLDVLLVCFLWVLG
jgi:hypothetical protein